MGKQVHTWPHFQTLRGELKIRHTVEYSGQTLVVWKCGQGLSWVFDESSQG